MPLVQLHIEGNYPSFWKSYVGNLQFVKHMFVVAVHFGYGFKGSWFGDYIVLLKLHICCI